MDAALPVETVNILAHDLSNVAFIDKLNHRHVALRWPRSCYSVVEIGPLPERQFLAFLGAQVLELLLVGSSFPAAWPCLEDSVESAPVVRDATSS